MYDNAVVQRSITGSCTMYRVSNDKQFTDVYAGNFLFVLRLTSTSTEAKVLYCQNTAANVNDKIVLTYERKHYGRSDRWTDGWMDLWMEGWSDGRTEAPS